MKKWQVDALWEFAENANKQYYFGGEWIMRPHIQKMIEQCANIITGNKARPNPRNRKKLKYKKE